MSHITYQYDWGFATYDVDTEQEQIQEVEDKAQFIKKFDVTDEQREIIDQKNAGVEVVKGKLVVTEPQEDPLAPIFEEQSQQQVDEMLAYQEWLETPEGKTASKYVAYMQTGEWPEEKK